jgi:hypothetical protein
MVQCQTLALSLASNTLPESQAASGEGIFSIQFIPPIPCQKGPSWTGGRERRRSWQRLELGSEFKSEFKNKNKRRKSGQKLK